MQAIPYGTWVPGMSHVSPPSSSVRDHHQSAGAAAARVERLVAENAVVIIGRRGCCMSHVVKRLLLGHGVNPAVLDVDEDDEAGVTVELRKMITAVDGGESVVVDSWPQFPVVFVGGKLFGGLERVMATHISGELVPVLKEAGALWL